MRHKNDALRGEILAAAASIAQEEGAGAVSIRHIAARVGVATGTVYNYFPAKDDILLALAEEFWKDAVKGIFGSENAAPVPFVDMLEAGYKHLAAHMDDFRGGMLSGLRGGGAVRVAQGKQREAQVFTQMREALVKAIAGDAAISPTAFAGQLTPGALADFTLQSLVGSLARREKDIAVLCALLRRSLYT